MFHTWQKGFKSKFSHCEPKQRHCGLKEAKMLTTMIITQKALLYLSMNGSYRCLVVVLCRTAVGRTPAGWSDSLEDAGGREPREDWGEETHNSDVSKHKTVRTHMSTHAHTDIYTDTHTHQIWAFCNVTTISSSSCLSLMLAEGR